MTLDPHGRDSSQLQISDEILHSDELEVIGRLLQTNDPPSGDEELACQKALVKAQHELAQLPVVSGKSDVSLPPGVTPVVALTNTVDSSLKEETLRRLIEAHKTILSPVRRLPAEMISEIILHALGYYNGQPQYVTLDVRAGGVWLSTRICSRWRAISLSLCTIWSHIRIDRYPSPANFTSIFDTCIQRSGMHLLTIVIRLNDFYGAGKIYCRAALEQAVVHCRRWKNVILMMGSFSDFKGPLKAAKGNLPCLEYISVERFRSEENNSITPSNFPVDILCDAPRLRGVGFPSFTEISSMQLPWIQLTRYTAKRHGLVEDLDILTRLCNLEDCTLVGRSERATPVTIPDTSPVRLPHLRKLDIGETLILRHLLTPVLNELSVDINWASDLKHLSPFIRTSACSLSTLTIRGPFAMGPGSIDFSELPALSSLTIDKAEYSPYLIDQLMARNPGGPTVLPNLQSLRLTVKINYEFRVGHVLKMVALRRWRKPRVGNSNRIGDISRGGLKVFYFEGSKPFTTSALTSDAMSIVRKLQWGGMDIKMNIH